MKFYYMRFGAGHHTPEFDSAPDQGCVIEGRRSIDSRGCADCNAQRKYFGSLTAPAGSPLDSREVRHG